MTRVVFVSEIPVAYRHGWFTYLGEHSDQVLRADVGIDEAELERLREIGVLG